MEPNPYASSAEQPVEKPKQRMTLLIPLAFIASLFALYCTLPFAFGEGGIIDEPINWPTLSKLFLAEMVIAATSGIAAFTTLAWASAKPLSLGRGVCISHLIVTGVMFAMLPSLMSRAPFFYYHLYRYFPPTITLLMLAEVVLLHFALRRFDRRPGFAFLTFALLLVVEPSASVMLDPGAAILWGLGRYFKLIQGMIVAGGQGSICLLLGLRLVKSANNRRDLAHACGGK